MKDNACFICFSLINIGLVHAVTLLPPCKYLRTWLQLSGSGSEISTIVSQYSMWFNHILHRNSIRYSQSTEICHHDKNPRQCSLLWDKIIAMIHSLRPFQCSCYLTKEIMTQCSVFWVCADVLIIVCCPATVNGGGCKQEQNLDVR